MGYTHLVPDCREKAFYLLPQSMMLTVHYLQMAITRLRKFLFIPSLSKFYNEEVLGFVRSFFCIYRGDYVIFILYHISIVYYINSFLNVKPALIVEINPSCSWCMIIFICWWIQKDYMQILLYVAGFLSVCKYSVEGFHVCIHWGCGL